MTDPYIGEIRFFAFNFPPRGWAHCDGQLLSISQNTALFSLLGTTYGGNGQTTFALPDLRGRTPNHVASSRPLGAMGGAESVTLTSSQMPVHGHGVRAASGPGTEAGPSGHYWAGSGRDELYAASATTSMGSSSVGSSGGSQPHDNLPPYLVVPLSICLLGIYPSRS